MSTTSRERTASRLDATPAHLVQTVGAGAAHASLRARTAIPRRDSSAFTERICALLAPATRMLGVGPSWATSSAIESDDADGEPAHPGVAHPVAHDDPPV